MELIKCIFSLLYTGYANFDPLIRCFYCLQIRLLWKSHNEPSEVLKVKHEADRDIMRAWRKWRYV